MGYLLFRAGLAPAGQGRPAGVNAEMMGHFQMMRQLFQMSAVQMDDATAGFAPEQETGMSAFGMGTILKEGAFFRVYPVDPAGGLQLFQLTIDGGQPHRVTGLAQIGGQIRGGKRLLGALFQAVQHSLLLFGGIYHRKPLEYENENRFHIINGYEKMSRAVAKNDKIG